MKSQIYGAAALLIAALTLGGCVAALKGFPDRVANTETELTALKPFMNADAIKAYKDATGDAKKLKRDEYVNARISAIDLHFGEFEKALFQEGVGGGIATDWLKLALGGAGTLYAGASQALSAAVTGIEGAKASFDKQAFFANTITTLFAAMDANRKTIHVKIQKGLARPVANYTLTQAFADLEDYYVAGTIPGALISINADSGAKGEKADKDIKFERDKAFLEIGRQKRVDKILDMIAKLTDSKAIDLIKIPPVADAKADQLVQLRDPGDLRLTKGDVARQLLKMRAVLSKRSDEALDAWEAAVKAAESPAGTAVPRPPVEAAPLNVPPGNPPN